MFDIPMALIFTRYIRIWYTFIIFIFQFVAFLLIGVAAAAKKAAILQSLPVVGGKNLSLFNLFCRFLNPNYFFQFEVFLSMRSEKPPGTNWKGILFSKIVLTYHCLKKLFIDLKMFAKSRPSISDFKSFSRSLGTIFYHSR